MARASGRLVPLPPPYDARQAFVPNGLPPFIDYDVGLLSSVSRADYALGGIASIADFVPTPELFVEPLLRVEAVLSSRIEGTQSTAEDVFRAEATGAGEPDADTREVLNYLASLGKGVRRIRESSGSLNLELVADLHRELLAGVRGHDRSPGRFREVTVWVGSGRRSIEYASYIPPPWQEVPALMQEWEGYVRACVAGTERDAGACLIQCAFLHAQFEMIHPFRDGNGRLGRLLVSLALIAMGHLSRPVLLLSAFFEQHRDEYYRRLRAISEAGDWSGWVTFFLRGVEVQSSRALTTARALLSLRNEWQARLQAENAPGYLFRLLDCLFDNPYTSAQRVARQLEVTAPTAGKAIGRLVAMGLLEEVTGRRKGRQYRATALLRALEQLEGLPEP